MLGATWPTVPSLIASGRFTVPLPQLSDRPHSSATGTPIAWKNSSTAIGVGAAPTYTASSWSSPSCSRSFDSTISSAFACSCASSSGTCLPDCSSRTFLWPRSIAHFSARLRSASCSPSTIASRPAFSFSQMRGTAKNQLGRTSGRYAITSRGFGQQVTE